MENLEDLWEFYDSYSEPDKLPKIYVKWSIMNDISKEFLEECMAKKKRKQDFLKKVTY